LDTSLENCGGQILNKSSDNVVVILEKMDSSYYKDFENV